MSETARQKLVKQRTRVLVQLGPAIDMPLAILSARRKCERCPTRGKQNDWPFRWDPRNSRSDGQSHRPFPSAAVVGDYFFVQPTGEVTVHTYGLPLLVFFCAGTWFIWFIVRWRVS